MDSNVVVFWEDGCLPVESSRVEVHDDSFPSTELYLLENYEHPNEVQLYGKTFRGDCLSVHRSVAISSQRNTRTRNYDKANHRLIEDPDESGTFDSYSSKIVLMDAFVGDRFIYEEDPEIDEIVYSSADLALLCRMVPFADEDNSHVTLFENEYACLTYGRSRSESSSLFRDGSDFSYSLSFEFKQPTRLEWAMHCWVGAVVNLLSVVLCGDIVPDDIVFYSKSIGAEFRRFGGPRQRRDEQFQPTISAMFFPFSNMQDELANVISLWMERPSTLRGISDLYPHARYRSLFDETNFSLSMRLAEAAYADSVVADVVAKNEVRRLSDGVVDLEKEELEPIKRIIKELSSPPKHPFGRKLLALGERFDDVYCRAGLAINWDACSGDCKALRDSEAHGTLLGGLPQVEYDKMYALEQMGLLFYELAVLGLFPIDDAAKQKAQDHLFKLRRMNITIGDFWPK